MSPSKGTLPILGPDPHAPRDVHLVGRYAVGIDWQDGHSSILPFAVLRGTCACPSCRARAGGAVPRLDVQTWPVEIKREGSGLRIRWQDGHETTFEGRALREICRCAACTTGAR